MFSDLDNLDCLDFHTTVEQKSEIRLIHTGYSSCILRSSSQFQHTVFCFFPLNLASTCPEMERKVAL